MTTANWYSDPEAVLRELRSERGERTRPPTIAGYSDLQDPRRGGQGMVYVATQESTGQRVALKVLLEGIYASRSSRLRFEREIELVASLRHPHIVRVYDSGTTADGRLYFVMEYIDGVPLDQWVSEWRTDADSESATASGRRRPRSRVRAKLKLFLQICDAVNAAHLRGIIHRDLKPSNIRIDAGGEPHVLDFGLAKVLVDDPASAPDPTVSITGQFMGSLPWASPEQVRGRNSQIDVRSDVYSLGVMLYQALVGAFPYDVGAHIRDVMENIIETPAPRPSQRRPEIDDDVDTIVLKCLVKEPQRRYQNAGEVARDLRRYLAGEPIEAKRDSAWYLLKKTVKRYRQTLVATSALVVLAVAFAVVVSVQYGRTRAAREAEAAARVTAEREADKARQVQRFLQEMLASVDPHTAQGRDVSVLHELLDAAARRVGAWASAPPEVEAAVRSTLGQTYLGLGLLADAGPHLRAALDIRQRALGDEHPDTLAARVDWSTWLLAQSATADAEPFLSEALATARRVLGPDHATTLNLETNWGYLLHEKGALAEAEQADRAVLERLRHVSGPEHADTLRVMNNLSTVLQDLGRWEQAGELIREVVEVRRRTLGPEHPETLTALNNLAIAYESTGRYAEAETLQREVLAADLRVLGERHPLTLTVMNNLADVLRETGRLQEAETVCRKALALRLEVLGEGSEETFYSMNNLARILQDQGRWAEAEPVMRRTVELATRNLGPEHLNTLIASNSLAGNLEQLGQVEEAERLYRSTLDVLRRTLGPTHPNALTTLNNLAGLLRDHDRPTEAIELYRELLRLADEALPKGHWYRFLFQSGLGRSLALAGRYEDAERELLASSAGLTGSLGAGHTRVQNVRDYLVEFYTAWGKPERAAEFRDVHRQAPKQATAITSQPTGTTETHPADD